MPDFRNLVPKAGGAFFMLGEIRIIPRCDCWTKRPRWTVEQRFWFWWRCVDCGRYGKREVA